MEDLTDIAPLEIDINPDTLNQIIYIFVKTQLSTLSQQVFNDSLRSNVETTQALTNACVNEIISSSLALQSATNQKTNTSQHTTSIIVRLKVEGIHSWSSCPIDSVRYLQNTHRHQFHIIGKKRVSHLDRDIEFIDLSHEIKSYLKDKYWYETFNCCDFNDKSCEMIATEIMLQFGLDECEVNEDGEGGAIVKVN